MPINLPIGSENEFAGLVDLVSMKEWVWESICEGDNFQIEWVEQYPDLPWNWSDVTSNPNITYDIIIDNMDKPWNFETIANQNSIFSTILRDQWINTFQFKYIAAKRIHRFWRNVNFNPVYVQARKHLTRTCLDNDSLL